MNPRTFPPTVSTMVHALPYMQYPAATISLPGTRTSLISPTPSVLARYTPKMLPTDTQQSMLEDPSSGSKTQTYRPWGDVAHMMASSSSSLTSMVHRLLSSKPLAKTSCAMTSSFICCSPCTFVVKS